MSIRKVAGNGRQKEYGMCHVTLNRFVNAFHEKKVLKAGYNRVPHR